MSQSLPPDHQEQEPNKSNEDSLASILASRGGYTAPYTDPFRGFYGIVSAVCILEAITIVLSLPMVAALAHGLKLMQGSYLTVLTLILIGLCAVVKKPWLPWALIATHIALLAAGFIHPAIALVTVVFIIVWAYVWYTGTMMRKKVRTGQLYGQRPLDT